MLDAREYLHTTAPFMLLVSLVVLLFMSPLVLIGLFTAHLCAAVTYHYTGSYLLVAATYVGVLRLLYEAMIFSFFLFGVA